jgi:hypothetical protein
LNDKIKKLTEKRNLKDNRKIEKLTDEIEELKINSKNTDDK